MSGTKRTKPEEPYWGIALRVGAIVDLFEAFCRIFATNRIPSWGLSYRLKEMEWEHKRKAQCKWPFRYLRQENWGQ